MNKLEQFTKRLVDAGLTERQIDEAVTALNEYLNAKLEEELNDRERKEAYEQR